jgi:hypothetical protein
MDGAELVVPTSAVIRSLWVRARPSRLVAAHILEARSTPRSSHTATGWAAAEA